MNCPQCSLAMQVVKTDSHYGTPIYLDQCSPCGGIWFDGRELWGVKQGKAQEIDAEKLVQSTSFQKETLQGTIGLRQRPKLLSGNSRIPRTSVRG